VPIAEASVVPRAFPIPAVAAIEMQVEAGMLAEVVKDFPRLSRGVIEASLPKDCSSRDCLSGQSVVRILRPTWELTTSLSMVRITST
jgi:hypothetical protein